MRVENAEITIKIPLPIDKPDRNGVTYSKPAIKEGLQSAIHSPLQMLQKNGDEVVIGVVHDARYIEDADGDYALFKASLWHGGTCEEVIVDRGIVTAMSITGVGIATN